MGGFQYDSKASNKDMQHHGQGNQGLNFSSYNWESRYYCENSYNRKAYNAKVNGYGNTTMKSICVSHMYHHEIQIEDWYTQITPT